MAHSGGAERPLMQEIGSGSGTFDSPFGELPVGRVRCMKHAVPKCIQGLGHALPS